jgi:uncharacterized membrane protein YedE/YeeE
MRMNVTQEVAALLAHGSSAFPLGCGVAQFCAGRDSVFGGGGHSGASAAADSSKRSNSSVSYGGTGE